MIFSFQILSFILAALLCFRHRRERSSFLHMTARCSFDPCAGRSCVWGTIQKALPRGVGRLGMRAAFALRIFSGKIIYISRLSRPAGRSKRYFHGRGRGGKRQVQRRFLRKRGAAEEASAWRKRAEPSPSSLRDATSPEGGGFALLTGRWRKAPPSGELARERLRGFAPPWGSCRAATEGL